MNEKIKKLAVQAKLPDYLLEYGTELCVAPHLEKFAELIVRECRKVIADDIDDNSDDDFDLGLDHARQIIGEHFGVEK
jgi:hypothetical protein